MDIVSKPSTNTANDRAKRYLVISIVASLICWYLPVLSALLYPIRLFVTIVHEFCHALVAILTGGRVHSIQILESGSGWTLSQGGVPALICCAGYIGTAVVGSLLLQFSRREDIAKKIILVIGILVGIVGGIWIRPWGESLFGFGVASVIATAFIGLSTFLDKRACAFALSFLSVQLCLNAILDLKTLFLLTTLTNAKNDAVFMVDYAGMTPWFWAICWAGISGMILARSLRSYWLRKA